jgi:uncharacterized protein YecE (DUF72 family)
MTKKSVLESWAAQVPDDFRFSIKASRRITHFKRLKETGDETGYLLEVTRVLGVRLGVVLFQLPPNLASDLDRLDAFLALLPDGLPAAFEFRHASWNDDAVYDRLRARNFAVVAVDGAGGENEEDAGRGEGDARPELVETADWGYLRLRRPDYDRAALARWATEIAARRGERAFVFFKHEDEGAGPRMAAEFLAVASETNQPRKARAARPDTKQEAG